jgi:hypothetical protein
MMGPVAIGVLVLALAGALSSWVVGAVYYARTLKAIDGASPSGVRWLSVLAWPAGISRIRAAQVGRPDVVNKAVVALIFCITLAAATVSLSTNLNRVPR